MTEPDFGFWDRARLLVRLSCVGLLVLAVVGLFEAKWGLAIVVALVGFVGLGALTLIPTAEIRRARFSQRKSS